MKSQKSWRGNWKDRSVTDKLTNALFAIYLIALFWILLFKLGVRFSYMDTRSVNLIPFREPLIIHGRMNMGESILNVVIFVPLGIYAGVLFRRWALVKKLLFFFSLSLLLECLQYLLKIGAFDITDIITNTSGGIIGLLIFQVIEKLFNNSIRSQKFINIISAVGTVSMILLLLLLKLNMLPVRYQ